MNLKIQKHASDDKKTADWRKLAPIGWLALWAVAAMAIYMGIVMSENILAYEIVSMTYMIAGCVLLIAYLLVNGGFGRIDTKNIPRPEGMDGAAYEAHIRRVKLRKKYGRRFLIASVPLIFIPLVDFLLMYWFGG